MRGSTSVRIIEGDAVRELARLQRNSVDLIVTSPPYADSRKDTYGGVDPDKYPTFRTLGVRECVE
jgi:site-specific DNA-methyltransferase (adenine-specific)